MPKPSPRHWRPSSSNARRATRGGQPWAIAAAAADITLVWEDPATGETEIQGDYCRVTPGGAIKLLCPAIATDYPGTPLEFYNAGAAGQTITVRDSADTATVASIEAGQTARVWSDGTGYVGTVSQTASSVFSDAEFRVQDNADATKKIAFEAGKVTPGQTRTMDMPDWDVPLAGVPFLIRQSITTADLTAGATSQAIPFGSAIPAKAIVTGAWFDLDTVFSGGGAAVATIDVGDGVDADGYVDNEDIFTGATTGQRTTPTTSPALLLGNGVDVADGARTPEVLITSDVNVDTLVAGELTAFIMYVAIPAGAVVA